MTEQNSWLVDIEVHAGTAEKGAERHGLEKRERSYLHFPRLSDIDKLIRVLQRVAENSYMFEIEGYRGR